MAFGNKPLSNTTEEEKKSIKEFFKPSVDLEILSGIKIGVYGRWKVGKTHFALTAPLPIYVVDTEGSCKTNSKVFTTDRQHEIFISEVVNWASKKDKKVDLMASLDAVMDSIDVLTDMIMENPDSSGTIVIDSASDIWDWLNQWLELTAERTKGGNINRLEWGKANRKYTEFMYMLLRSNWNVIMTFRSHEAVSDKGQSLGYDKPKWQKNTPYWLDLIAELQYDGVNTIMKFRGDRFGRLTEDLKDPTWDSLMVYLKEKHNVVIK